MRGLRQTLNRFRTRENATFAIVPAAEVPAILPELKAVSDDWLLEKGHGEKGFSLARFDPAYLALTDCAVVRVEGRIVAFANIWKSGDRRELSVDLMRHVEDAPGGVMDYLFVELMLWGQRQGYGRFALGLAPLSGVDGRRLGPTWAKIAALGVRIVRGCSLHGLAVNVRMDLEPFARINPCGYAGLATVDLGTLGVFTDWATVAQRFGERLSAQLQP